MFGVPGKNPNGKRVIDFCAERGLCGLCLDNTYIKHKSLHKHTRVARGQDAANDRSCAEEQGYAVLHAGCERRKGALSDHHVVLCKVRLVGSWIKRREVGNEVWKIRSKKLREHKYTEGYNRCLESESRM